MIFIISGNDETAVRNPGFMILFLTMILIATEHRNYFRESIDFYLLDPRTVYICTDQALKPK